MVKLEERLRDLSKKFNLPEKAYSLLHGAAKQGKLPDLETQFTILQQSAEGDTTTFSVQLLIDYLDYSIPLYAKPPEVILNLPRSRTSYSRNHKKKAQYSSKNQMDRAE